MIAMVDIGVDDPYEIANAGHGEATELSLIELAEEAFDEIEPRGACGHEMEMDARVAPQPPPNLLVFVGGVVVEDNVDVETGLHVALDRLDELEELLVSMPGHALMNELARLDLERSKQGRGSVPLVVVGHRTYG